MRDFPDNWPTLFAEINKLLGSGDIREVIAGCQASLELIKAFEYVATRFLKTLMSDRLVV